MCHQNIQEGWETKATSQILAVGDNCVFVSIYKPFERSVGGLFYVMEWEFELD